MRQENCLWQSVYPSSADRRTRDCDLPMDTSCLGRRGAGPRWIITLLALSMAVLTVGCAQTRSAGPEVKIERPAGGVAVLLMPADVNLSLLTTSGLLEPNAEWTQQGRENVIAALKAEMGERAVRIVSYGDDSDAGYQIAVEDEQLVKLHTAVGEAIRLHKYVPGFELPTKKNKFDWTLGEGVRGLRESHDANYALFIHATDSFSSEGRVALNIALVLLGAGARGGQQTAFASLIDLESGAVVWFNVLVSTAGDLRDPKQARQTIDQLFDDSPL